MSTATAGRAREYQVRDHLETLGWERVMRAAASKGAADLLMGHETYGAALIQVGTRTKHLGPEDRARFLRAAHITGALPIEAIVHRGRITYRLVHDTTPRHWPTIDMTNPTQD